MMSRLETALRAARDTKRLEIGRGSLARGADVFRELFPGRVPVQVCDPATFGAVARAPADLDLPGETAMFKELHAEWKDVVAVQSVLAEHEEAIPVAVGSGTINDLVKLASHRLGRPYLCVATAASMDGYTAYGASITKDGSKQTFDCPAPAAVVADIDVIDAAPSHLTASGYADLLAKVTAGADWIVADALGIEPIERHAWETVQSSLRDALQHPIDAELLTEGLIMSGFAMQAMQSSRPASGAEHQFSHLWDMQHHTHEGVAPSHGFKVGVATIAVARFYEKLMKLSPAEFHAAPDVERDEIEAMFEPELRDVAVKETAAKANPPDLINRLRAIWPELVKRLRAQLPPADELASMLARAGAPTEGEQIGISRDRLRRSFRLAYHIRRRFTVLDLATRTGVMEACLP
jgi:glycerol-1-phosphate dehydrogenase [NAD(P)+]